MSSDPKKPFDAPPPGTPDLLRQEIPLDRRAARAEPPRPIPPGTVPARPAALQTDSLPSLVPPGLTPRSPPLPRTTPQPLMPTASQDDAVTRVMAPAQALALSLQQQPGPHQDEIRTNPQLAAAVPPEALPTGEHFSPAGRPSSAPTAPARPALPTAHTVHTAQTREVAATLPPAAVPRPPAPPRAAAPAPLPPTAGQRTPVPPTAPPRAPGALPPTAGQRTPVPPPPRPASAGATTAPNPPLGGPAPAALPQRRPSGELTPGAPPPLTSPRPSREGLAAIANEPVTEAARPMAAMQAMRPPQPQPNPPAGPPIWPNGPTQPVPAVTRAPPAPAPAPPSQPVELGATGALPAFVPARGGHEVPPSPQDFAQQRRAAVMPQVTPSMPSLGAVMPEGNRTLAQPTAPQRPSSGTPNRAQPAHVEPEPPPVVAGTLEEDHDEPRTVPAGRPQLFATPAAPPPRPGLPPEMLVTQPGMPGPYAGKSRPAPAPAPDVQPLFSATTEETLSASQPGPVEAALPADAPVFGDVEFDAVAASAVTAEPAPVWRRLGAWLTDLSVVAGVTLGFLALAVQAIAAPNVPLAQQLTVIAVPGALLAGVLAFVYTALFGFLWAGRTPGRRLFGIYLVDATGHAPAPLRALVRATLSLLSFGLFLSGFWLALFDRHGQTLHDKLTRTFVVRMQNA